MIIIVIIIINGSKSIIMVCFFSLQEKISEKVSESQRFLRQMKREGFSFSHSLSSPISHLSFLFLTWVSSTGFFLSLQFSAWKTPPPLTPSTFLLTHLKTNHSFIVKVERKSEEVCRGPNVSSRQSLWETDIRQWNHYECKMQSLLWDEGWSSTRSSYCPFSCLFLPPPLPFLVIPMLTHHAFWWWSRVYRLIVVTGRWNMESFTGNTKSERQKLKEAKEGIDSPLETREAEKITCLRKKTKRMSVSHMFCLPVFL